MRKHYKQMSFYERKLVRRKLDRVRNDEWRFSDHALEKIEERDMKKVNNVKKVMSMMKDAYIIEYHIKKRYGLIEERILLRSREIVNGDKNLCAVFSITDKKIVTMWFNRKNDWHQSLNKELYTEMLIV